MLQGYRGNPQMDTLDHSLIAAFTSFGSSVDRIAAYQTVRAKFLGRLSTEARTAADDDSIIWRLLQLRKSGRLPKHHPRRVSP